MDSLIMFDYDGVIADSFAQFRRICIRTFALRGYAQYADTASILRFLDGNWFESLAAAGVPREIAETVESEFEAVVDGDGDLLLPFAGMPDVLDRLSRRNTLVIITSGRGPAVRQFLERHRIDGISEVLGSECDTSKLRKIHDVLRRHPSTQTGWYIGDTVGDIIEAREAGVEPIGVGWGWHGADRLKAASPARLVLEPAELLFLE